MLSFQQGRFGVLPLGLCFFLTIFLLRLLYLCDLKTFSSCIKICADYLFSCRFKQEATSVTTLAELGDTWKEYDVIGIDEGQFYQDVSARFSPKLTLC